MKHNKKKWPRFEEEPDAQVFEDQFAAREWDELDVSAVPGGGVMVLKRESAPPHELAIYVDGIELMADSRHGSEELMAALGWMLHENGGCFDHSLDNLVAQAFVKPSARANGQVLPEPPPCRALISHDKLEVRAQPLRVLIGGLGMGFTLRSVLQVMPSQCEVVVAELIPKVVEWNCGPLGHVADYPLADSRVQVVIADVSKVLRQGPGWDLVLLDVDNGPTATTQDANERLYGLAGIQRIMEHLRPGGVIAVWSVGSDEKYMQRLRKAGLQCHAYQVPAVLGEPGIDEHTIFMACV